MKNIIVPGSPGLIGSEVVAFFHREGYRSHGISNISALFFFSPQGDTRWSQQRLVNTLRNFEHHELDIRDRQKYLN